MRDILLYGVCGGLLIAVLKLTEYRFLVVEHSVEIYGALVAALFAGLGIWLGQTLTRKKPEMIVQEKIVKETIIKEVPVPAPGPFVVDEARVEPAWHHRARTGDSRAHRRRVEQSGNCRPAIRQRKHGEDPFQPPV